MSENERLAMKIERCEDVADISARLAAAESRAARLEEKVRRILSACGLPNPAEACRVALAIAAEEEGRDA